MPTILIIDDNEDFQEMLRLALGQYDTISLYSYEELKEFSNNQKVDLILLDYHIGLHTAEDLLLLMKDYPNLKHLPIILLTGSAEINDKLRSLSVREILEKPFKMATLKSLINNYVGKQLSPH